MTVKLSKAKQLCTKSEYDLVLWSSHKHVQELTPSRLKQKIDRARKLRDKYRKLAQSQRREARGKQKPRRSRAASGNENTEIKAQVFAESLERFEKALKKAGGNTSSSARKKTSRKKTKAKTSANEKATAKKKTTKKKSAAKQKKTSKKRTTETSVSAGNKKKTSGTSSGGKKAAKTIPSAISPTRKPPTITGEPTPGSPFGMVGTSAKAEQESRATRRKKTSKHARPGTLKSQFARTNMDKIHGHVSAQTKRRQAKRDS